MVNRQDLIFCRKCAKVALAEWKGWPHRDKIPMLPQCKEAGCDECGGSDGVSNKSIAWLNHHSEFSTGLPDYWLLVIAERPDKWGSPYFALGQCPSCGATTVVSEMLYPNGTHEFKHNCNECGVIDL